jgi:hypothetical protein
VTRWVRLVESTECSESTLSHPEPLRLRCAPAAPLALRAARLPLAAPGGSWPDRWEALRSLSPCPRSAVAPPLDRFAERRGNRVWRDGARRSETDRLCLRAHRQHLLFLAAGAFGLCGRTPPPPPWRVGSESEESDRESFSGPGQIDEWEFFRQINLTVVSL